MDPTPVIVIGLACLVRLAVGLGSERAWTPVLDVLMVLAALMLIAALREFTGQEAPRWYLLLAALIVYGLVQAVVLLYRGALGGLVLLDLTLGLLFGALAGQALAGPASGARSSSSAAWAATRAWRWPWANACARA